MKLMMIIKTNSLRDFGNLCENPRNSSSKLLRKVPQSNRKGSLRQLK
jgi:hypothetical protein